MAWWDRLLPSRKPTPAATPQEVAAQSAQKITGQPKTAGYRPSVTYGMTSWGMFGWGAFSLGIVDEMRDDSQVDLMLRFLKAPLDTAELKFQASDPRVKTFVEQTFKRFWRQSLPHVLRMLDFGHSCGEAIYEKTTDGLFRYRGMEPLHPRDVVPWTDKGKLYWLVVQHVPQDPNAPTERIADRNEAGTGGVILKSALPGVPAKGLWFTHDAGFNKFWGRSVLRSAWYPWRLKRMPDGVLEVIFKYAYRHALGHTIGRHPDVMVDTTSGPVFAQDLMREMLTNLKNGADICFNSDRDDSGNYQWSIEQWADVKGNATGLLEIMDFLDKMIQRGIGIPDEIITHDGNVGGYSRSQVAASSFFLTVERILHYIIEAFGDQVVKPLVALNFGPQAWYVCEPKPLIPPEQQEPEERQPNPGGPGGGQPALLPFAGPGAKPQGDTQPKPQGGQPQGAKLSLASAPMPDGWGKILTEEAPHVRIVGQTQSGKTVLAQALASQLPGKLVILDPVWKPGSWGGLPAYTVSPDGDYGPIAKAIDGLLAEMKRRGQMLQQGTTEFERLTIVFDEVPDTVSELPDQAGLLIRRLAQRGRHGNMHLIGIGQSSRVSAWGIGGYGDTAENFATVYLGAKAVERNPELAGEEHPGILEWRGIDYGVDLSGVMDLAAEPISADRVFMIPGVPTPSQTWDADGEIAMSTVSPGGRWVTMEPSGTHVYLNKAGHIEKGPKGLVGHKPEHLKQKTRPANPPEQPSPTSIPEATKAPVGRLKLEASPGNDAALAQKIFGHDLTAENLASKTGATGDATIRVRAGKNQFGGESVDVEVEGQGYKMNRSFYRDRNGQLVCMNQEINVTDKGKGLGAKIFCQQVKDLSAQGADRITCIAAGAKGEKYVGYAVWPKMGYDGPLEEGHKRQLLRGTGNRKFLKAKTIQELYAMPGGRQAWEEHGSGIHLSFDLKPGSKSMKILEAYQAAKAKQQGGQ